MNRVENKVRSYIALCRPANVVTAMADVLAGISIALFFSGQSSYKFFFNDSLLLLLTTSTLYAGGIVFNDIFDADIDRAERPERIIPSGIVSIKAAQTFAVILFLIALASSALVHFTSFLIAASIAICALLYDYKTKHHAVLGPLNMGVCRGLNLLLGISLIPEQLKSNIHLAIAPLIYIFAVTTISRDEVHGGSRKNLATTFFLYLSVFIMLFWVGWETKIYSGLWLLLPFFISIMWPLFKAWQNPYPGNIIKAVKAGILSIIFLDATWAAIHHQYFICGLILCLLPLSILLGKYFAVT